jgi:hypothetical protein
MPSNPPTIDPFWYVTYQPSTRGPDEIQPPVFDYSKNGHVFLQEGTIFYSPNCTRLAIIPPHMPNSSSPFNQPRLNTSMFKQPIWWSEFWGWLSFIPLAPSFLSAPFTLFSWMPRIEKVDVTVHLPSGLEANETRFKMSLEDILQWKKSEELVVDAARRIQLFFGIQGTPPPAPSTFHYDRPHKTYAVAKRMICISRDWFVVWMGFLSFLISRLELCRPDSHPSLPTSPLPDWYNLLRNKSGYADSWLDGLSSSTVCSFDLRTPRAGIVFRWVDKDERRPSIEWFYHHHVPLWFTWTSTEEQEIRKDHRLSYLEPPVEMVQQALTLLFTSPNLPMAGLIMKKYFKLGNDPITNETLDLLRLDHAPSYVFQFTAMEFINQTSAIRRTETFASKALKSLVESRKQEHEVAAKAAASFPAQGMLEPAQVGEKGKLFNHSDDFFSAREKRQAEMIRVESARDRQRRESRDRDRPIKNTTMYTWEKVRSSGGKEMYMRVRVNKRQHEDIYSQFTSSQRVYNAALNEWDFCEDFCFPTTAGDPQPDPDSDPDSDMEDYNGDELSQIISEHRTHGSPPPPMDDAMDIVEKSSSYSRNVLETLKLNYGYSTPLVDVVGAADHTWEVLLLALGFVKDLHELSVSASDKCGIPIFLSQIAKDSVVSPHLFDLHPENYSPLEHLFKFANIQRPSKDLFVFFSPQSMACEWNLGVHSSTAALYVCRYIIENPQAHTFVTIARRLLERNIPFRTLLALPCSPRQKTIAQPYTPSSHREKKHKFTVADFEAAMLRCQAVLSLPQGRAALLRGGIVARIAKEYLSVDGVLAGPSLEVTAHRVGYLGSSGTTDILYCDDELTENEIAAICGTYTLYTGNLFLIYNVHPLTLFLYRLWASRSRSILVSSSCLLECCSQRTQVDRLDRTMRNLVCETYGKHPRG